MKTTVKGKTFKYIVTNPSLSDFIAARLSRFEVQSNPKPKTSTIFNLIKEIV